eukprot:scaffold44195_cov23-Cyclotella_meneghiniana.AAC.2
MEVFGKIACRVTSKITGSGGAERGWSDNKELKSGKRSHISTDKLKKQGLLYTSANIRRAQIKRDELEKAGSKAPGDVWDFEDEQFGRSLEKWGLISKNSRNHRVPTGSSSVGWKIERMCLTREMS